jgi:hypothetical protein
MRDEVQNPMRENSQAHNQGGVFPVEAAVSAADCLIRDSGYDAPKNRRNQAVRVWMKIRIEHAASGETLDNSQFLNPKQHKSRPYVIEKLNSNE